MDDNLDVKVDFRLKTFQDMGRICTLFPGAYFDHGKSGWFCRKCQAFALPGSFSNPWISKGVALGDHPSRKLNLHFSSDLHKKSLEAGKNYVKPSVQELIRKVFKI